MSVICSVHENSGGNNYESEQNEKKLRIDSKIYDYDNSLACDWSSFVSP